MGHDGAWSLVGPRHIENSTSRLPDPPGSFPNRCELKYIRSSVIPLLDADTQSRSTNRGLTGCFRRHFPRVIKGEVLAFKYVSVLGHVAIRRVIFTLHQRCANQVATLNSARTSQYSSPLKLRVFFPAVKEMTFALVVQIVQDSFDIQ